MWFLLAPGCVQEYCLRLYTFSILLLLLGLVALLAVLYNIFFGLVKYLLKMADFCAFRAIVRFVFVSFFPLTPYPHHTHTSTYMRTHTPACTHTPAYARIHTRIHIRTCSPACIHPHTYLHAHTYTPPRLHARTQQGEGGGKNARAAQKYNSHLRKSQDEKLLGVRLPTGQTNSILGANFAYCCVK